MTTPFAGAATNTAKDDELEMLRTAANLESENPRWIVVYGVWTKQFIAFPRFTVPEGTMATAHYPGALLDRMRAIERAACLTGEVRPKDNTRGGG